MDAAVYTEGKEAVDMFLSALSCCVTCRVSKVEVHNRMNPNSLAIVFAPCILRCPDSADPLMSMKDVAKTTM